MRAPKLEGTFKARIGKLPGEVRSDLEQQLGAISAADAAGFDLLAQAARATAIEQAGLFEDASAAYSQIASRWPGAVWARHAAARAIGEAEQQRTDSELKSRGVLARSSNESASGIRKTYALVIGISQYRPDSGVPWLSFADHTPESHSSK